MSLTPLDRSSLTLALAPHLPAAKPVSDTGHREMAGGVLAAGAFFVVFLGWAAVTPLNAATYAQGEVTVSGHRQSVQYGENGIVSAIRVKEGQKVKAGDVLIELNGGEILAQERAQAGQVIDLQAQKSPLQAEQLGLQAIAWPAALLSAQGDDQAEAKKAMAVQQTQFNTRRVAVAMQKSVLRKRGAEVSQQIEGFNRQIEASDIQRQLLGEELKGVQSLAEEGFAPQSRVRDLQRSQAELGGQKGQFTASIAQARDQASEAQLQVVQVDKQRAEDVASQLRDTDFQLAALEPKLGAARDQAARQLIRAPEDGAVMGLAITTVGGVIAAGERLMDVVPDKAQLVLEARIAPKDADEIRVGKAVEVKFPSIHDRQLRTINANLTKLSPDAAVDPKTGASYFLAEASLTQASLRALQSADRGRFDLKPGLPVQILIPLHSRTVLQYLMDPVSESLWRSFRER
jgi:HlyD family secretion protein